MPILLRFLAAAWPAVGLTAAPLAVLAQAADDTRPNVIVFVGDDLGWRDTGAYGNGFIRTPNIDRLARSGLRVEYAFGTTPQCSPSRISTLTGKYAHAVGAEDLHTPLPKGERILPLLLQEQGYFTGHMAKTHYGPNAERQFQWYSPKIAEAFPAFLDSAGTRPFFLWVGFHQPHRPYEAGAATEQSGDFPADYRLRDDNTDRITGVPFTSKIPPLRNMEVPPPADRWGRQGPS